MDQADEQQIRQRAYELWLDDGKPEGSHLRFWKEAEAEIAESKASYSAAPPTSESPHDDP